MVKEYDNMKKEIEIQILNQFIKDFSLFTKHCYRIVCSAEKVQKVKTQKLSRLKP